MSVVRDLYFFVFHIRDSGIEPKNLSVIRDLQLFPFVNHAGDPPCAALYRMKGTCLDFILMQFVIYPSIIPLR